MKRLKQKKIITLALSVTVILWIIYVNFDKSTSIEVLQSNSGDDKIEPKFLFCLIKTTPNALKINKTLITYKIWGSRCSNYRFVTLIPDELLNKSVKYGEHREIAEPFYILQPEGLKVETRAKLTDKVYSAMRYVYSRFGDYEWYLIVDDDAYINMENMMEFLNNRNSSAPVTYGHDYKIIVEGGMHAGGCGYVLTGEAFRRVGNKLVSNRTFCQNTGVDDVDLAVCLRTLDVYMNPSLDDLGRERFLAVNFLSVYIGPVPDWLFTYSAREPQSGPNCCSDSIVAIHYMKPHQQILLDAAFNMERYRISLLNNLLTNSKLTVTFKNVVDHYFFLANQTLDYLIN